MKPIRAFLMLALPLLLPFGVAQAAPYDATAPDGDLQVVCKDFQIDGALVLKAKCNKKGDDGNLSLIDTSYNVGARYVVGDCREQQQRIEVTAESVKLVVSCVTGRVGTKIDRYEYRADLTALLTWDSETGWSWGA